MPQTAFLFPGQGAQALGMGQKLAETFPSARALFDDARAALGYDLLNVCVEGPVERLNSTAVSQPAIFVASLAALESLRETAPDAIASCVATAGLSLGEYTGLVFAGMMSFEDGLRVVRKRGEAMQAAADKHPGGMVSVIGLTDEQVETLCAAPEVGGRLRIANRLCPGNLVLSGDKAACEAVTPLAEAAGGRAIPLAVAGAFHTDHMKPADEALATALDSINLGMARIPVWSNVDARPHTDPAEIRELLVRQVLEPVLWEQTVRNLLAERVDRFYEIGPGRVLAGLLKRVQRKADCRNVTA
jgi:[acyl-carrier-protein] S-malonyltransferase